MSSSVLPDGITVYVYARTDVGMKRQGNEDSFLIADLSSGRLGLGPEVTAHQLGTQGSLMIVSDGLGGAAAGEVASAMAVQTVCTELMKSTKSVLSPNDRLKRATEQANEQIWACAQSDNSLRGMGATLTAAFIYGNSVYIAQVGDSRAYIVRDRRVKQVTEDQSWANAVKKAGLDVGDVPNNVILQALGTQPKVHVEVTSVDLLNGDVLLLCSDGLSNKIKDLEMREIANSSEDLAENCRQFIELANKRGGEDNITVVLARFVGKSLLSGMESDLSITSTFKVVTPLDFGEESLDENETMSFQGGQDPKKDTPDPMAITQNALLDAIPTLSNMPALPNSVTSSKEPAKDEKPVFVGSTSPLGSDLNKAKNNVSPNTTPFLTTDIKSSKASTVSPEKAAFRLADTKTDLPAVPVFDLSKEPTIESKVDVEPEINIEFVPTSTQEPRIASPSVLAKPPNQASFEGLQSPAKSDIIALPPKPSTNIPVAPSSNPSGLAKPGIIAPPPQPIVPPIAPPKPPIPTAIGSETKPPISLPPIAKTTPEIKAPMPPISPNLAGIAGSTPAKPETPIVPPVPTTKPSISVPQSPVFSGPGLPPPPVPTVPTTKPSVPVPTTKPSVPVPNAPVFSGPGVPPPQVPTTKPNIAVPPPPLGTAPKPPIAPPPMIPSGVASSSADAKPLPPLPMPPPVAKAELNPVSAPLGGNLFAPPPKPTPAVASGDKQLSEVPRFAPPPATLPSTPLNLFAPDSNSAALPPSPKPMAPSPLSAGSLFAPPPKASSPNAPKVDDFLDNALFSPATPVPPKPTTAPPPRPPIASKPGGEGSLENSLFAPPSPRSSDSPDPMLGVSTPGLIFPEAFKEKNSPPPMKTLDDEPDPIMLETLSVATPEEPRDFKAEAKLFAPPLGNVPSPMPPLVPPPIGKADPNKPAATPLFAAPSPNKMPSGANPMVPPMAPPINTLPPPIAAKTETGPSNDPKSNRTGVEVLASLFSAPVPNKPAPTTGPSLPPPPVKGEIPRAEVTKDPLKPAPPALVLPPNPKKADIPPVAAPPLKPSIPTIAPPPMAPPPKPLAGPMAPPPPPVAEDKGIKWGSEPTLAPGKTDSEKKAPLFSPPPSAPSKPVNLPPPPGPAPVAKTGIPPVAVPPAKIDLPPAPKPSPAVNLPPTPSAKQSPAMPPPPVASKPSSFDEESALTPPPSRSSESTAFSEISTEAPSKKESQINPKLILALGGVVVFIVTVGIVIFMFLGKGKTTQTTNTATPTPVATTNPETTPEPVPSPVATTKPQPSPVQASEPPVPKDTPGLVKYSLEQLNNVIERAQKELPDSDPAKEVRLRSLKAFRDQLSEYVTKNIADDNARNYAETALSQVKGVRAQLDALPKSSGNKGGKKK